MSAPVIPVGLGTKVGLIATALMGVVAALTAVLNGDHSNETIAALVGAVVTAYGVVRSRGDQAAAIYAANGQVPFPAPPEGPYDPAEFEPPAPGPGKLER